MHFLAFEGLDGSGKSTLMQLLQGDLERRQHMLIRTREPGGTALGDQIRQLLLTTKGDAPTPRTEALLYQAGRAQHVEQVIQPALKKGQWVLCDRYAASSLAFQAGARGIERQHIEWLNTFSTQGLEPDLYILLDLSVEESRRRLEQRGQEADRFEQEAADFHQRVRQAYLQIAGADPKRWLILNAAHTPAQLLEQTLAALKVRQWLV